MILAALTEESSKLCFYKENDTLLYVVGKQAAAVAHTQHAGVNMHSKQLHPPQALE